MKHLTAIMLLCLASLAARAAEDPLAGVDPLFRDYVLQGMGDPASRYHGSLPTEYSNYAIPALEFVGARTTDQSARIVYAGADSTKAAFDIVKAKLVADGWDVLPLTEPRAQHGFIYPRRQPGVHPPTTRFCHARGGSVGLARGAEAVVMTVHRSGQSCRAWLQQMAQLANQWSALPMVELPGATKFYGGGGSRSGSEQSDSIGFDYHGNLSALHEHFAQQLLDQGWESDGEWIGHFSLGSGWRDADRNRRLSLTVLKDGLKVHATMTAWPADRPATSSSIQSASD